QSSLVGAAFPGTTPEQYCARWLSESQSYPPVGIKNQTFSLHEDWRLLCGHCKHRPWLLELEEIESTLPLFEEQTSKPSIAVPEIIQAAVGTELNRLPLITLEQAGLSIGQGLRTGCNGFFYVDEIASAGKGVVLVRTSETFGSS